VNKQNNTLLAIVLFLSCVRSPEALSTDTQVRNAMASTVKIHVSVEGIKKGILCKTAVCLVGSTTETIQWAGSGVVIENSSGTSLIATAAHVTNYLGAKLHAEEEGDLGVHLFVPKKITISVETLNGTKCLARQISSDIDFDVAILQSQCIAGTPSELADEIPPVGSTVMVSGAPLGIHPKGVFIVNDGRYVGIDDSTDEEVVTLPATGGDSGAGIFFRNRVIGIVSKRTFGFEHAVLCVKLDHIHKVLLMGRKYLLEEEAAKMSFVPKSLN
jgi:S1-C subfamily serine protease